VLPGIPLLAWRQRRALTQRDLARLSGVGLATIVRIEHRRPARPSTVRRLAKALDVTPEELIEGPISRPQ
jgi:transcriptional regulator with XRE-family HTH domain